MIAATFALAAESSDFIRLLQNRSSRRDWTISGTLHTKAVRVLHTGVGEKAARARMDCLFSGEPPRLLISAGFAGALNGELRVGEMLLAENFCTRGLIAAAASALATTSFRAGKLNTSASVIDSTREREELARATGALAVDMETAFIAEACATRKIPMLSLRVITDTPASPMPAPPHVLFDIERQRTRASSLLLHLVQHPRSVRRLAAFARQVRMARAALTRGLDLLLQHELL